MRKKNESQTFTHSHTHMKRTFTEAIKREEEKGKRSSKALNWSSLVNEALISPNIHFAMQWERERERIFDLSLRPCHESAHYIFFYKEIAIFHIENSNQGLNS